MPPWYPTNPTSFFSLSLSLRSPPLTGTKRCTGIPRWRRREGRKKKKRARDRAHWETLSSRGSPFLSLSLDRADTFLPGTLCIPLASFAVSFLQEASIFILHNAFVIAACTLYLFRFCNAMKMYEAIAIIRTGMQNFSRAPGLTRCRQVGKESKWTGEWDCRIIKGLSCVWTPSFSSFRFLSPPFLPFLLLRRSRYGSVDESLANRNGNNLSIHLSMRDEIINEFVKGIIHRKIAIIRQDICCFYFFAVCPPYSSGIKWVFDEDLQSEMRTSFHFIRYSIERERGMKNGAITLVRTDL